MQAVMSAFTDCSLKMSVVAIVFLIISPFLSKRYSVKWQYYAWLIIIMGFIIPVRPNIGLEMIENPVNQLKPFLPQILQASEYSFIPKGEVANHAITLANRDAILWVICSIWAAGALWIIVRQIFKHCRFMKAVKRWSGKTECESQTRILHRLANDMGIPRKLEIKNCALIASPMMTGILRPTILLPKTVYTEIELEFIIKHELVHYKRKDLWYKFILIFAKSLHWFNPVIWLIIHIVDVQCELSCDEAVIANADRDDRKRYSLTILNSVSFQSKMKTELSTYLNGGKKIMKNRLLSIANGRKKKVGVSTVCLALLMTICAGTVISAETTAKLPVSNISSLNNDIFGPIHVPTKEAEIKYLEDLGIIYDEEKDGYCYDGRLVGLFMDQCRNGQGIVFYNSVREVNLKVVRSDTGKVLEILELTDDVIKEQEEYVQGLAHSSLPQSNVSKKYPGIQLNPPTTKDATAFYSKYGINYDIEKEAFCYEGKIVGLFLGIGTGVKFWSRDGEVNLRMDVDGRANGKVPEIFILSDDVDYEIDIFMEEYSILMDTWD